MKKFFITALFAAAAIAAPAQNQNIPQGVPPQISPNGAPAPQYVPAQMPPSGANLNQGLPLQQILPGGSSLNSTQSPQTAQTPPPPVNVYEKYFPDIDGITGKIGAGFWESNWIWVALAAIAASAAGMILFRRKKTPPPSPYEVASSALDFAEGNSDKLSPKEYGSLISQAVRNYIEAARQLPAPERTTEEFLKLSADSNLFDSQQRERLENILRLADMAKFAKHSFRIEEKLELLGNARSFINEDNSPEPKTTPEPQNPTSQNSTLEK